MGDQRHGGGLPLWFVWTGRVLERSIERGPGLTSSYREAARRYLGGEPASAR